MLITRIDNIYSSDDILTALLFYGSVQLAVAL